MDDRKTLASENYPQFTAQTVGDILIVTLTESQADISSQQLGHDLDAAVRESGARKVIVDLGQIQYLWAAAFRPLLRLRRKVQAMNGRLVLCGLPPMVADVFHVVALWGRSEVTSPLLDVAVNTALSLQDFDEADIDLTPFESAGDVNAAVARANE
jgi:anti-sigma B factor antagonist